mgnify:CR=1 FL=1
MTNTTVSEATRDNALSRAEAAMELTKDRNASPEALRAAVRDLRHAEDVISALSDNTPGAPSPLEPRAIRFQESADEVEERIGDFVPLGADGDYGGAA